MDDFSLGKIKVTLQSPETLIYCHRISATRCLDGDEHSLWLSRKWPKRLRLQLWRCIRLRLYGVASLKARPGRLGRPASPTQKPPRQDTDEDYGSHSAHNAACYSAYRGSLFVGDVCKGLLG